MILMNTTRMQLCKQFVTWNNIKGFTKINVDYDALTFIYLFILFAQ